MPVASLTFFVAVSVKDELARIQPHVLLEGCLNGRREINIRPSSIPSTKTSETFLSTVLAAPFTASVGVFCATNVVEKARGAKAARLRRVGMVLVRNDIVIFKVGSLGFLRSNWICGMQLIVLFRVEWLI